MIAGEMEEKCLKHKAISGMYWSALQKYSMTAVSFVSGIILARLLSPYDYGCIGMLAIFMALANTFIDAGFGSALIQKKNPTQTDYSTIFYYNIGMACVMYTILFFLSPAIGRFYNIPQLCPVLRVQALVLFVHAFNIIQRNQLKKKLNFKLLSIVSITTSIVSLSVTIIMAYHGFGVWSLVSQNLISAAIPTLFFWFYVKWHPVLVFSCQSFRELFGFGAYMLLTHFVNTLGQQIQSMFIGKLFSPVTLGFYSKALGTESLASHSISSVITQVTYPLYSEVQNNRELLASMIRKLTVIISYFTFPLMLLLMLLAKPIFVLLYSDRWLPSVPYFQVLCIVGISSCLQAVNTQSIAAIGRSRDMFTWTLLKRILGSGLMLIGLFLYGMKGFLVGLVLYNYLALFVNIGLVSKYIGYHWKTQIWNLMPVVVVSLFAITVSYIFAYFVDVSMYKKAIAELIAFLIIYLGWSFIFKPTAFTYTLGIIPARYKFWETSKGVISQ
jgi:O-antigen/teichoic acid export membrane protein